MVDAPLDVVPADICSNAVLVTSAFAAQEPLSGFHIFHNTTSTCNPMKPLKFFEDLNELSKFMPAEIALGDPGVKTFANEAYFNFRNFTDYEVPVKAMDVVSKIPMIGSKKMQEQVNKIKRVREKIIFAHEMLGFFQTRAWMFENKELCKLIDTRMSPQDKKDFWCDARECNI